MKILIVKGPYQALKGTIELRLFWGATVEIYFSRVLTLFNPTPFRAKAPVTAGETSDLAWSEVRLQMELGVLVLGFVSAKTKY